MSKLYTGHREVIATEEAIDKLYNLGKVEPPDRRYTIYPNQFVTLKNGSQSAITRMKSDGLLHLVKTKIKASGIAPRNREQIMAMDLLLDDDVPVVFLTGRAGSGKTILCTACAIQKIQDEKYQKMILTRPMSQVGRRELGILRVELKKNSIHTLKTISIILNR